MDLASLIEPKAVAIVGASAMAERTAGRPVAFLRRHGFLGAIWPVNPKRETIQELPCFPDLDALPAVPDQVYVVLGTEPAMAAIEKAVSLGVPLIVVLADGFGEAEAEGQERERRLQAMLADSRSRLIGPNSLGYVRPPTGLVLSANAAFADQRLPAGPVSVISQSGSTIGTFVSRGRTRGVGFANLVSVGNESDLSVGEVGRLLVDDPATESFLLFLESIKHPEKLEAFAAAAKTAGKPVLVYKIGRSAVGAAFAVSHTGALMTTDMVADAFLTDLGFHRLDTFEAAFEAAPLFAPRWRPPSDGRKRVSVVTTTGGGGALVADRLALAGLEITGPSDEVRVRIKEGGIDLGHGPLIDLTLAGANPTAVTAAISALMDDPSSDAIVAAIGSSAESFPELAVQPIIDAAAARSGGKDKPIAVFTLPEAAQALTLLADAGIAGFRTPEACADGVAARLTSRPDAIGRHARFVADTEIAALLVGLPARVNEHEALGVFEAVGVPAVRRRFVPLGEMASLPDVLADLRPPLVAKVAAAELGHKSEHDAVRLGLMSSDEVTTAVDDMLATVRRAMPSLVFDGILLQEQVDQTHELLLGLRRDPLIGPVITIGMGGFYAELERDPVLRRAPVSTDEANAMIREIETLSRRSGFRGAATIDLEALSAAVAAFSQLGAFPEILEAEINPLLMNGNGKSVLAVDGLLVLSSEMPEAVCL